MVRANLLGAGGTSMYGVKLDGLPLLCHICKPTLHLWRECNSVWVWVCNRLVTDAKHLFDVFYIWNHDEQRRALYEKLMVAHLIQEISRLLLNPVVQCCAHKFSLLDTHLSQFDPDGVRCSVVLCCVVLCSQDFRLWTPSWASLIQMVQCCVHKTLPLDSLLSQFDPDGAMPCSQDPASALSPEPVWPIPHQTALCYDFQIIHLRLAVFVARFDMR
jgi:hypothetical protein